MRRALFISAGVITGCVAAWYGWGRRSSASPIAPTPAPVASPGRVPVPEATPERSCRFITGHRFAFDVSTTTAVTFSDEFEKLVLSPPQQPGLSTVKLEVLDVESASAVLLARLTRPTGASVATEGLDATWLARVDERCAIIGFARHRATPRKTGGQQQSVLHELMFTLPPHGVPTPFTFDSAVGRAVSLVFPRRGGSAEALARTIQRYDSAWAPMMNGVVVERSRAEIQRGSAEWFEEIEGFEEFSVPGAVKRGSSTLSVKATTSEGSALAGAPRERDGYLWESCFDEVPDQRVRSFVAGDHPQRVEAMRHVTYPEALEKMLSTFDFSTNLHVQSRDMAASLDAHPEDIPEYAGALLTEFEPEWKAAGFMVLASTQNAGAREVLLDVWRERQGPDLDRIRASLALLTRKDVGLPLAKELLAEAGQQGTPGQQNVARQALLHVGILAGLRPGNAELVGAVRGGLLAALASRRTWMDRSSVFAAIGNTGDVSFLPQLEQASRDTDPKLRGIVAIGFRRMPVEATRAFTLDWLRRETSPDVMWEIFEVLQQQYEDVGKVVDAELAHEAVRFLRRQPGLLTRQSSFQLVRPLVDTDEAVRAAFRDQLKVEYERNTGMFPYLASSLPEGDVQAVLSTIDSLADQHRGAEHQPRPMVPTAPRPATIPVELLPRLEGAVR
ncbi:MAG: hypothetical protein INH41_08215 [Myxococcaceae bacterium]|jgi:hypothetical protein|nr:hypothetical protein [Myxococcaceae bacterium]